MERVDRGQQATGAREKILLSAHELFYRHGIRATGIDKIIAQARVTKVTFYRHFPSKNDLILAYLEYRHTRWLNRFSQSIKLMGVRPPTRWRTPWQTGGRTLIFAVVRF